MSDHTFRPNIIPPFFLGRALGGGAEAIAWTVGYKYWGWAQLSGRRMGVLQIQVVASWRDGHV
jgi:hypothetical protein